MKDAPVSKRAFVAANGCPENRIDAAAHGEFLRACGWDIAPSEDAADLVFFSACGLTQACEDDSIRAIQALKRNMRPSALLVVGGCLTRINPRRLSEVFGGPMVPPDRPRALAALIGASPDVRVPRPSAPLPTCWLGTRSNGGAPRFTLSRLRRISPGRIAENALECVYRIQFSRSLARGENPPGACFIKVGSGCQGHCAYCAVKLSRGQIVSKPPNEVLDGFRDGLARGCRDFVLLGTDQGSYGADIGTDLPSLLHCMIAEPGDYSIRIRNLEPMGLIAMFPQLEPAFASGRIALVSTPVQTGSDRMLQRMKRHYSIADFSACVRTLNTRYPNIRVLTQVMVGFPGETEEDFRATLRLLDDLRFDFVEVYCFSPRPNTEAAAMADQVPEDVKTSRHWRILWKVVPEQARRRKPVNGSPQARLLTSSRT